MTSAALSSRAAPLQAAGWPASGGEMGTRLRTFDWSATPLGAIHSWPQSLRTAVDLMLAATQPAYLAWGEQLTILHNDGCIPILGNKHPGALGLPFAQLWPEVWDEYEPIVRATMAGAAQHFVDRPVALAGRPGQPVSWFTFSWTPLRDESGRVRGFYCAATETTDNVRAAETRQEDGRAALRASESRYRTLFEAIDEGFCIVRMEFDADGRARDYVFVEVNPAFERQTGMRDAVGRSMREFAPAHEEHWFETYGQVALSGAPRRFEHFAAGLGERWFDVFAFRVGEPRRCHVAILFNDITARKCAEQALRDADRHKDEFIATLAHELRNPLAPIRNGLQIARLSSASDAALQRTVDMMDRQLSHLVRLVDDLLDVGRISAGKLELQRQPVELGRVLASSMEAARSFIEERRHHLDVQAGAGELWLMADFDRLAQVFTNLLHNAAKYTPPGGTIRVLVSRTPDRTHARVDVVDSGIGIPAPELPQVFDLFSQVRSHQAHAGGGLGIGLALARQLITLHGGRIEAASEGDDRGSALTVHLPLAAEPPDRALPQPLARPAAARGRRVLVADDNIDAAESLAELLRLLGHEVVTVSDGEDALVCFTARPFDAVFLDLGMPHMDGLETARRLRETPQGPHAMLVAVTGWGLEGDRLRTRHAGFDLHLVKPVDPAELTALLDRLGDAR